MTRMWEMDQEIAKELNEYHKRVAEKLNWKRPTDPYVYKINDHIWVKRPNETGGIKLDTRWHGPYRIVRRTGEHSYEAKMADLTLSDIHVSQTKPCHWENLEGPHTDIVIPPLTTTT